MSSLAGAGGLAYNGGIAGQGGGLAGRHHAGAPRIARLDRRIVRANPAMRLAA